MKISSSSYWILLSFFCLILPSKSKAQRAHQEISSAIQPEALLDFYSFLAPTVDKKQSSVQSASIHLSACEAGILKLEAVAVNIPKDALPSMRTLTLNFFSDQLPQNALPDNIINITATGGYAQMTPSTFIHEGQLQISIQIEEARQPEWSNTYDIVGLSYSSKTGAWTQLSLYQWDEEKKIATFLTDPFAEFIAGIIQTPEVSPTVAFASTEIKDYKTAPPHDRISMINAPSPNNMGSASLSYPIEIPPGRAGMQPNLSINYNSEGGNGWLGVGWDLSVPSISVDTRWGVPLYDEQFETETYTFQGQMLYPVAHRGDRVPREEDKVFYPRVEGQFAKIIRHGSSPSAYRWEVVGKDGKRSFYGGTPESGNAVNEAILVGENGIAQWFLVEERDRNDNVVRYTYSYQSDSGPDGNHSDGYNRYLSTINYTGHGEEEGRYTVRFIRDQEMSEPRRMDAFQSGAFGFKKVTTSLLRNIEVTNGEEIIRDYQLIYAVGAFGKSLLQEIKSNGQNGTLFYTHDFSYYDDTTFEDNFRPLSPESTAEVPGDDLKGKLTVSTLGYQNETTVLGGNRANNYSIGIAVTVGPPGNPTSKRNTGGGHYSFTQTQGYGINTLLDINGDSRPDKIFVKNGHLYVRFNLGLLNGTIHYGDRIEILGSESIKEISRSKTQSHSYGGEANFGGGGFVAYISKSTSKTKTTTPIYFQDFNADGLLDLAYNRIVFFNRLDENGIPTFESYSSGTPNPINMGVAISDELAFQQDEDEPDEPSFEESNPLHDAVRVWIVPYGDNGSKLRLQGTVSLQQDTTQEAQNYLNKDGVRISIEHEGDTLRTIDLEAEDTNIYTIDEEISSFDKGDMIYLRVHSKYDGAYDKTSWDVQVDYLDEETNELKVHYDANGKNVFSYNSREDFHLVAPQELGLPMDGNILIKGDYSIAPLTDTLFLRVERRYRTDYDDEDEDDSMEVIDELVVHPGEMAEGEFLVEDIEVNVNDRLAFCAFSNSNVDWQKINWNPVIEYNNTTNADGEIIDLRDSLGVALVAQCAAVDVRMFNNIIFQRPNVRLVEPSDTNDISISVNFALIPNMPPPAPQHVAYSGDGLIYVSLKGVNSHYASACLTPSSQFPFNFSFDKTIPHEVVNSDSLFIDVHFSDYKMYEYFINNYRTVIQQNGDVIYGPFNTANVFNIFTRIPEELMPLGPLYRSWGQFSYKGEGELGENAIDPDIVYDALADYRDAEINAPDSDNPENLDESLDPTKKDIGIMYADIDSLAWQGYDNLLYINRTIISSSRLGEDNKIFTFAEGDSGEGLTAPVKINRVKSKSWSGGISYSFPLSNELLDSLLSSTSVSALTSTTSSRQSIDLIDCNLDGYPDLVANGVTQFTDYTGGRTELMYSHNQPTHEASSTKNGFTAGGSLQKATLPNTSSRSGGVNYSSESGSLSTNFTLGEQASVGVTGYLDENLDDTEGSWQDVNGDGLPDIVKKDGTIKLNYGYFFGPTESWNTIEIRKGKTLSQGASASISQAFDFLVGKNKVNASWTLGASMSKSENHSIYGHQDVNGDGFADILTVVDGDLYARINLGQQYLPARLWKENFLLDEGLSVSESINGAFTIGFNFFFVRLCFNPKGYIGRSVNMPFTKITDIDGDGFPDFLKSSSDDNLTYSLSKIGRTNKLRTVSGPLGSEMTFDYEVIPSSYENPNPKWVLSSVETYDGYEADGVNVQKTAFEYQGGHKDRREREFYGFAQVLTHSLDTENSDAVYRTTIQTYSNDTYYTKGLLLTDTLMDADGQLFITTQYDYELRNPLTSTVQVLPIGLTADDSLAFPALRKMTKSYYEGAATAGIVHTTRYNYDLKGNTILYVDEGNGTEGDEVRAVISYHSIPSKGIFNIPSDLQVRDHEGTILRHRNCEINNTNGNVEIIRQFFTPSDAAIFEYQYDTYGNIVKVTRPENLHGQRMIYNFTYDNEVATYVIGIRDNYGYSSSATYDYSFGVPLETTDLNGNKMVRAYDAKGRLTHLTGPYELAAGKPYTIKMEYYPSTDNGQLPHAICRHYNEDTDSDILTITFVDGLGRAVQVKKSGLLYQSAGQDDQEILNVSGKVKYDAFGRKVANYYPLSEPFSNLTTINTTEDSVEPTIVTYDVLDRQRSTTLPDQAEISVAYSISPAPDGAAAFATINTDPLGNKTEVYTDVRGRKLATVAYGPEAITTRFTYNAIAEMIAVTDQADNTTTFTYDLLGRQTSINHPVSGLTELFYDPVGNVTRKLTANIRDVVGGDAGILYDYEYERPKTITYPLNYQNKVQYTYGDSTATNNRRGKVTIQQDASGAQEFFYGPMGEVVKTIRTVLINPTEIRTYVSEARYDSWNRVQQLYYPDGEVVDYTYNAAGKLSALSGLRFGENYAYVDRISYDKFEKRRFLRLGNGTEQEYTYDPQRQWLAKMAATSNNVQFMDVDYTYDPVANILSVSNTSEPAEGEIGGAYTHNYSYDELYRLDYADGEWTRGNRSETYTLNMTYNATHNILVKEQERMRNGQLVFDEANYYHPYEYQSGRPFVPSKVGRFHYDYDLNGNLLSVTDTTSLNLKEYEWDEDNRLKSVTDNGYQSKYSYDANGERAVKSHGPITGQAFNGSDNGFIDHRGNYTAYISPYLVARQGTYTKHYFIEGQRITSKIGQGEFNNNAADLGQGTVTAGNIDFASWLRLVQQNELAYYGDSLIVNHPNMPFRYLVPDSTGEAYPDLLPDTVTVSSQQGSFYVLPSRPDLSGNSQASHPAWERDSVSTDSLRAGYGLTDTIYLPREVLQYFYHSDHVGSTAYITDRNGRISQFAVYTAFGELFVEDQTLNVEDSQSYLFNGKERDRETGLNYYGARYYEPISSMWMSVDPLANKYPGWSPYNFTMLNPVKLVDPDGRETITDNGNLEYYQLKVDQFNANNENYGSSPPDYYLNYGDKYIKRFNNDLKPNLSKSGQEWVDKTTVNLQKEIEKALKNDPTIENDNERFNQMAFDSHPKAYLDSGLLELPLSDKMKIALTPDLEDIITRTGMKQVGAILEAQVDKWISDAMGNYFSQPYNGVGGQFKGAGASGNFD